MIRLAPLVPVELAAALALLLILLEVVPLSRRSEASPGRRVLIGLLWTAGVALALLPLLGVSVERPLASAPAGLVLVDDSRSMATEDAILGRSRFEAAEEIARSLEREGFGVAPLSGGSGVAPASSSTSLGRAIERARSRAGAPAAIVLVTDGAQTTDEDPVALAREARASGTEIDTVLVGRTDRAPPPRLSSPSLDAPPRVETGAHVAVRASALVEGLEGAPVTFELALDGAPVASVPAFGSALPALREATFDLPIAAAGEHELRVTVKAGERSASARRFVVARDRVLRVALIDLPARWEHRWLRRALEDTPSVALARVELYTPEHSSDADLRAIAAIESSDVVILGDVPRRLLGADVGAALVHAVDEERKGLIVLGGRQAMGGALDLGLAPLLPTDVGEDGAAFPRSFRPEECEAGRDLLARALGVPAPEVRAALSRLPALGSFEPLGAPRPGALVLLEGPGRKPLLALGRYGLGRTAILATDETWRWAFTGESAHEGGQAAHAGLFRELVRAVAAPAAGLAGPIDVTLAHETVEPGEHVLARVSVAPLTSAVRVIATEDAEDAETTAVSVPSVSSVAIPGGEVALSLPVPPGARGELVLHVTALDAAGKEIAREDRILRVRHSGREERVGEPANAALLARIADAGGGKAFAEEDVSRGDARRVLAAALEARRRLDRVQAPLATGPGHVLLLALLLSAAWGLRRGAGLR